MALSVMNPFNTFPERWQTRLAQLPARDRKALQILGIALLCGLMGLVYFIHKKAVAAEQTAAEQQALLVWIQSQAPHLTTVQPNTIPLNQLAQQVASAQNLPISQTGSEANATQVTANHAHFSVLGTWLTHMAGQGAEVRQLDLRQLSNGTIQMQTTLQLPMPVAAPSSLQKRL